MTTLTIDEELQCAGIFEMASEGIVFANPADKNLARAIAKRFFTIYIFQLRTYRSQIEALEKSGAKKA